MKLLKQKIGLKIKKLDFKYVFITFILKKEKKSFSRSVKIK